MFAAYFKTSWRGLLKDRLHTTLNIAGLSLGMAIAVIIGLWCYDELSFDRNVPHYHRLAQVIQHVNNNGEVQTWRNVPYPLAEELRRNYGGDFAHIAMAVNWNNHLITAGNEKVKASGGYFEPDMPEMLGLEMLQGTRSALNDAYTVLLSEHTARAWFGQRNAVGQMLQIDNQAPLKVAGVYKDMPRNSTFYNMQFMAPVAFWYHANNDLKDMEDPWRPNFTTLYVQLNDKADMQAASVRIKDAKLKKINEQLKQKKPALLLHPMSDWHLYNEFKDGVNTGGAIRYVRLFALIGVFILLLACINFMNLSTARSEKRAREVGIRKTMGSLRSQLAFQFFTESLLTVAFAFVLALLLAILGMPVFNQLSGKDLHIPWTQPVCWLVAIVFIIVTALIAGSYPAFYLSSFRAVQVLKGTFRAARYAALPRRALVVVQFVVAVTLITGTVIIYKQIQYARNRSVGYTRDRLLRIDVPAPAIHEHFAAFEEQLKQTGVVSSVAESESPTTGIWNTTSGFSWPGKDPAMSTDFGVVVASAGYGNTIGWKLKAGRDFSRELATDSSAVIINEAAAAFMHLDKPVGTIITWWNKPVQIIGVVENMIIESPYAQAKPVMYSLISYPGNVVVARLNGNAVTHEAVEKIGAVYRQYYHDLPFEYSFVDDDYDKKFGDEQRIGRLSGIFTGMAVLISCLGLFGLTSFVAEQRKKEIGVRKVLGASVWNVCQLLSAESVVLVSIAFLLSVPVSSYFMYQWLGNFAYRTGISWWIFLLAGIAALVIALITVSLQAVKAALANPVKNLRSE